MSTYQHSTVKAPSAASTSTASVPPKARRRHPPRVWIPVISPAAVVCFYFVVCLLFAAVGVVVLLQSLEIDEIEIDYTDMCNMSPNANGQPFCHIPSLNFTLSRTMRAPIYIYYKLNYVYQNYRKYSKSLSPQQLSGSDSTGFTISECDPRARAIPGNDTLLYNPCGLIAWSMFNDTFSLLDSKNNMICNGPDPKGTNCTKQDIAWNIERETKFKIPPNAHGRWTQYNTTYYNETGHVIPRVTDEDLMVWMRLAAFPTFRKMYRVVQSDLPAGNYRLTIDQNYPIGPASLKVRKMVVIAPSTWFGGKNMFLAIAYLSVSGVALLFSCLFVIASIVFCVRERRIANEVHRLHEQKAH